MEAESFDTLLRLGRRHRLFEPAPSTAIDLDRAEIEKLIPHRAPFLFVDRVTGFDAAEAAVAGTRRIDPEDPLFGGHFPQEPIYPGVLQLEIMGQLGLCLLGLLKNGQFGIVAENQPLQARFVKIHHAIFLAAIRPGDELVVLAKLIESDEFTGVCAAQIVKGDAICAFAVMEVYFVDA